MGDNMNSNQSNKVYGKRPLWQWVLIYVLGAGIIYFLIYYLFILKII